MVVPSGDHVFERVQATQGLGIARTCALFPRRGPSRSILDRLAKQPRAKQQGMDVRAAARGCI
eukprot:8178638-Pyramimonas_sp.AAC.1